MADIFQTSFSYVIFFIENVSFPIEISLKFVPKGPCSNIPSLVQKIACRRPGDKPCSEPMVVSLLIHICVARPQWIMLKCISHSWTNTLLNIITVMTKHEISMLSMTMVIAIEMISMITVAYICMFPTFFFLWFTNFVLLFDKSIILGCLWPLVFVLNNILILGIWCSTIPHLPGCFVPGLFLRISDSTRC